MGDLVFIFSAENWVEFIPNMPCIMRFFIDPHRTLDAHGTPRGRLIWTPKGWATLYSFSVQKIEWNRKPISLSSSETLSGPLGVPSGVPKFYQELKTYQDTTWPWKSPFPLLLVCRYIGMCDYATIWILSQLPDLLIYLDPWSLQIWSMIGSCVPSVNPFKEI